VRILPMGRRAVLVDELGSDPAAWAGGLRALSIEGVVDVVPAAATVLVACDSESSLHEARRRIAEVRPLAPEAMATVTIEIPVRYDGPDLDDAARRLGIGREQLIALHTAPTYRVAFCGFSPGFAYLAGTDPRLHLQRRATPRTSVPAGSVAVAAGYTAVYPRASPGGWQLLGSTELVMFDPDRTSPALLEPGAQVRLVAT
jgi:KipI family sensor histidine kinase inhibitor